MILWTWSFEWLWNLILFDTVNILKLLFYFYTKLLMQIEIEFHGVFTSYHNNNQIFVFLIHIVNYTLIIY